jgi:hypothetical protein
VATADMATAAPPAIFAARADASAARVASLIGCLAVGAPAPTPGAVSSATSAALGEGGEGSHLSEGAHPPSLSSSSSSDDEYSEVAAEESPCCSHSRNSSLLRSRALPSPDPLLLLARRLLLLPPLRRARLGSGRGRVGPRGVHNHHLQGASETLELRRCSMKQQTEEGWEPYSPAGPWGAW